MKQKLLSLLALVMVAMTASAVDAPRFALTTGTIEQYFTVQFKVNNTVVTEAAVGDEVIIEVTPQGEYSVGEVKGQWDAAVAASRGTDFNMLDEFEPEAVTNETNKWKFTMKRAKAIISVTACKLLTHADISIGDIADVTYNGGEQKPAVVVKDGDKTLVENTDYTLSYSNNTNAGTATVTITGIGKYGGEVKKTYGIQRLTVRVSGGITVRDKDYDGTRNATLDAILAKLEGKVAGDDLGVVATGRFSDANAGNYKTVVFDKLTLTGRDKDNYVLASRFNQTYGFASIRKVALTVRANAHTIGFGDAPSNSGVTYSGFVGGESATVLGGPLSFSYNSSADGNGMPYEAGKPMGTYYIIPGGLSSKNYDITYVAGTLTVTQKEVVGQDVSVGEPGPDGIPVISVSPSGGAGPQEGTDYTVAYYDMDRNPVTVEQMMASPGQYIAVLTFKGGYSGTVEVVINVVKGNLPVRGDVNKSGSVELKDVRAFMDAFLNGEIPDDPASDDFIRFDANGDGSINVADAQAILNLALGLNADGSKKE